MHFIHCYICTRRTKTHLGIIARRTIERKTAQQEQEPPPGFHRKRPKTSTTKNQDHQIPPSILIFHLPPAEFLLSSVARLVLGGALELSQLAGSFQAPEVLFPPPTPSGHLTFSSSTATEETTSTPPLRGGEGRLSFFDDGTVTLSTSGIQSLSFPTSAREGCECLLSKFEPPKELGMGDLPRVVPPITRGQTVIISARMAGMQAQIIARSVSIVDQ